MSQGRLFAFEELTSFYSYNIRKGFLILWRSHSQLGAYLVLVGRYD